MALLIRGKTVCPLCGCIIDASDDAVSFPPLTGIELDPLFAFSDRSFHQRCFSDHPLKTKVESRLQEFATRAGPGNRMCIVCGREIAAPDDYLALAHFTDDTTDPLYRFNLIQLHRSCIPRWTDAASFCKLLRELRETGKWKDRALDWLLSAIESETRH